MGWGGLGEAEAIQWPPAGEMAGSCHGLQQQPPCPRPGSCPDTSAAHRPPATGTFTLVHHTAPHIPFKPASEWNAAKAQLSGTVHCDYPRVRLRGSWGGQVALVALWWRLSHPMLCCMCLPAC